ncbi:hypothetical protein Tco_0923556 [Tanacetum coccineum]|uniref:Uncharacterized protein n=1 Tax=Tanacetum coccineum TaxID=301880 RepID=A0ABQ5D450_9ASTR
MSIIGIKVNEWYGYGHLEEIFVKRADQQLYTFKEGDFKRLHLNDIEDMLLLIVQKKLNNLNRNVIVHLATSLHMSHRPAYTTLSDPQGVIYEDKLKRKRFMRADELHKFSDGTLISVHETLAQMLHELHLGYNTAMRRRKWTRLDQQRTRIIIKAINQKLLDRRIMRSLEKFVGVPEHQSDNKVFTMMMEILPEPTSNKLCGKLCGSDEVLKLKLNNFKKDEITSFQEQEKYEHVVPKVTSSQDGKRSQDDDKILCLVDDLKEAQVHMQVKLKGTSSSLKSKDRC